MTRSTTRAEQANRDPPASDLVFGGQPVDGISIASSTPPPNARDAPTSSAFTSAEVEVASGPAERVCQARAQAPGRLSASARSILLPLRIPVLALAAGFQSEPRDAGRRTCGFTVCETTDTRVP